MYEHRELLAAVLQNDEELLSMLAKNKPWWPGGNGIEEKVNSIIPADKAPLPNTPYITIQYLADNLIGTNFSDAFFLIRCYNSSDRTYVDIDKILSRVKALLHRRRFTYEQPIAGIDTIYETTGGELLDEAFTQNFRESQYRILYI